MTYNQNQKLRCNISDKIRVLSGMSDEEILELSYKKPARFGELFDRHYGRFMAIAKKTLRSRDDAEDAVQEAFIRIYKYGRKFPGERRKV